VGVRTVDFLPVEFKTNLLAPWPSRRERSVVDAGGDAVERIVDLTQLPVLVDGDSGFGNFNNARRADRGHHRIAMHGAEPDVVAHQGRRRLACRSRALITTPSVAFSGSTFDHT
jgi:hypothetical protein